MISSDLQARTESHCRVGRHTHEAPETGGGKELKLCSYLDSLVAMVRGDRDSVGEGAISSPLVVLGENWAGWRRSRCGERFVLAGSELGAGDGGFGIVGSMGGCWVLLG